MPDNVYPQLTAKDVTDPTLFRLNSVVAQIFQELIQLNERQATVAAQAQAIENLVAPEGVSHQADTSSIPGDVRRIGADAFLIAQADMPGGDKAFDIEYDPPSPIGAFAGVYVVVTAPSAGVTSKDYFPGGDFQYNGDPDAADAARHGRLRVILPTPAVGETWRFYLVSYADKYHKKLAHFDDVLDVPSPNRLFDVTPAPQPAGEAMPLAETILGATGAVEYGVQENRDGTRSLLYHIKGDLNLARNELGEIADQYYSEARVFAYEIVAGVEQEPVEIARGVESYDGLWFPARDATFRLKFFSTNKANVDNPAPFTLAPDLVVEALPALPEITDATYELQRQVIEDDTGGMHEQWRLVGSWTQDLSSYQWYVRVQLHTLAGADGREYVMLFEVGEPLREFISPWYDQGASSTYQLQLVRVNRLEESQVVADVGDPFTVAPMADAPPITDPEVSVEMADFSTDSGLVRKYRFKGTWGEDVGGTWPIYWFTRVQLLPQPPGPPPITIAEESGGRFQTDWFDIGAPATYKARLIPVNHMRRESAPQSPNGDPAFSVSAISAPGNVRNCAVVIKTQAVQRAAGRVKQWCANLKWDLPVDTTDFGWCVPTAVFADGYAAPFTGHETEAPAVEIGLDSSWFDLTEEISFRVEFRTYNLAGDLVADPPTFPGYVLDPDGEVIPVAPAPGDVTPGLPTYHHLGGGKTEIRAPYTAPAGDAEFTGVLLEIESPDQSAAPPALADGTTMWDGTRALNGDQKPFAEQFPYNAADPQTPAIEIPTPTYQTNVRVRWRSCSSVVTNATGPSAVLVVLPPGVSKPQSARAYCELATWGANPAAAGAPYDLSGKLAQDITFSTIAEPTPKDPSFSGWEIWSSGWPDDPESYLHTGPMTGDKTTVTVECPKTIIGVRFWLRSFSIAEDGTVRRNPLIPGVTPSVIVDLGTTTGTLNAGEMLEATLSASLRVINKVLGVPTSGITEDLIATFAVSVQKLADAAVATGKLQDLSVITEKLAQAAASTDKLAELAVQASKLDNLAVLTGKLAELAVSASKLGNAAVTETKIDNLAVGNAAIKDLAVTDVKVATAAITSAKIQDLAVGTAAIALLAVGTAHMQNASITNLKLGALAVATANIQDLAVTTAKIQNLAITNALIQDLAVDNAKIQNCSISKLTAGSVSLTNFLTIASGTKSIKLDASNWLTMEDTSTKLKTILDVGYYRCFSTDPTYPNSNAYMHPSMVASTLNGLSGFWAYNFPWTILLSHAFDSYLKLSNGTKTFQVVCPNFGAYGETVTETRVLLNDLQVLTVRQPAITLPSGGAVVDIEARTAINTIISRMQTHGFIN